MDMDIPAHKNNMAAILGMGGELAHQPVSLGLFQMLHILRMSFDNQLKKEGMDATTQRIAWKGAP